MSDRCSFCQCKLESGYHERGCPKRGGDAEEPSRPRAQKEWWQGCPESQLIDVCSAMSDDQLQELSAEISSVIAKLNARIQQGSPDRDWLSRARYALGMMASRRQLVKAELTSRNQKNRSISSDRKRRVVAEMRKTLVDGDVTKTLNKIIDYLDPDIEK